MNYKLFALLRRSKNEGDNKMGEYRTVCTTETCSIPYPNNHFVLAIGLYEMNVNENIVQNLGY